MGCTCAIGPDISSISTSILQPQRNCTPVPKELFTTKLSSPVFSIPSDILFSRAEAVLDSLASSQQLPQLNRSLLLALTTAGEALQTADIDLHTLRSKRVGIILGTTGACTFHNERYYIDWKSGCDPDPEPVFTYLTSHLAERLGNLLRVHGPVSVVTNACASGTDAIGMARLWLLNDLCDLVLAGGVDELSSIAYHGFSSLLLTSPEPCRPFDRKRKGLNIGEGAGIIVMEREDDMTKEGRRSLGWIHGYGNAGDGYHPIAPHPESLGLQKALHAALAESDITPERVSLINAHGTGTVANDIAEARVLSVMPFDWQNCVVVSTKGLTGHTLGAAGAIETILTLMALNSATIAGTVGCTEQDPELSIQILPENSTSYLGSRFAINQSLAFGGNNSVLIIEGIES